MRQFFLTLIVVAISSYLQASPIIVTHAIDDYDDERLTLDLCADNGDWHLNFTQEQNFRGMHADIVKLALRRLGIAVRFHPMVWEQCIVQLKQGAFDGAMSVAYEKQREAFLIYPKGADVKGLAVYRTMAARHIFVSITGDGKNYDGSVDSVSSPIYVNKAWTIAKDLTERQFTVDSDAVSIKANLAKLMQRGTGSAIMNYNQYRQMVENKQWSDELHVHQKVFSVKNYFLTFTHNSSTDDALRQKMWQAIKEVREDYEQMRIFRKKYIVEK